MNNSDLVAQGHRLLRLLFSPMDSIAGNRSELCNSLEWIAIRTRTGAFAGVGPNSQVIR